MNKINILFEDSIQLKQKIIANNLTKSIQEMGDSIVECIIKGNKLMICGNGGSAADAQHLAAELLVRLRPENNRIGLPAIALSLDTSTITACGNDFGFEYLYSRAVQSLGKKNDVLLCITTSGNSKNILNALNIARKMNVKTFSFLGSGGGKALELSEKSFLVPSYITGRIQEAHITAGHALMEYVEDKLLEKKFLKLDEIL